MLLPQCQVLSGPLCRVHQRQEMIHWRLFERLYPDHNTLGDSGGNSNSNSGGGVMRHVVKIFLSFCIMWLLPTQTSAGLSLSEMTVESTVTDLVLNSSHNSFLNSYRSCFNSWTFSWPHTLSDSLPQATIVISSHHSLLMFFIILNSDTGSHWFISSTQGRSGGVE